jgi:DegV family protein with EDD domain
MNIQIVTDSTSDIPKTLLEELPITVLPLFVTINSKSYQDNVDLSRKDFYEALPDSDPYPTTAAPSPDQFKQAYDRVVDQGAEAIFSIHVSKTLSATFTSAETAAKEYNRVPVYAIDSGNLTMAEGLIVIKAAQAAKEGKSVEEIKEIVETAIIHAHAYAKLDTIDYLLKGGRMSAIQYSIVSVLGIKPILKMNNHVSRMEIARTKRKAFENVVKTALTNFPDAEIFSITHANVPDQVEELIGELKKAYPDLPEPLVAGVTPALGVHVGPGSLCVNWINQPGHEEGGKNLLQKVKGYFTGQFEKKDVR